ncbi:MAG: RNA 2',3'-cyclic phosphodiesterase [Desulfobacterales bacterium]|nr:RNA 2',3'-cyclic phosphodiesterase [Desulfobacterales bacterium]
MAEIRAFLAVDLSDLLKDEIAQIQLKLKKGIKNVKWVRKSNFHLTVKFLGNIDSAKLPDLKDGLSRIIRGRDSFSLNFNRLGGFPNTFRPKIIWLGVDQGKSELTNLQKIVETELLSQGFPKERSGYSPHLTLGRAKRDTDLILFGQILKQTSITLTQNTFVKSIKIFKSDLQSAGPIYSCLEEILF